MSENDFDSPAAAGPIGETVASNPGAIRFEIGTYLKCYPRVIVVSAAGVLAGLTLLLAASVTDVLPAWVGITVAAVGVLYPAWIRFKMGMWMANGDVCPGVVLDPEAGIIAVWADMSSQPPTVVPAIKILQVPLKATPAGPCSRGQRITAVCTYGGSLNNDRWDDIYPVPALCATKNQATLRRSLESVPKEQWQNLQDGLKQIPRPFQPGLTFLE